MPTPLAKLGVPYYLKILFVFKTGKNKTVIKEMTKIKKFGITAQNVTKN